MFVRSRNDFALLLVFALILTSSRSAYSQIVSAQKEAEAYVKDLVKQQKELRKRTVSITAHIGKTKHLQLDGFEQQALWAHEQELQTEQSVVERIIGFIDYRYSVGGREYTGAALQAIRTRDLTDFGRHLSTMIPQRMKSAHFALAKTRARQEKAKAQGVSKDELAIMQRELAEREKAVEVADRLPVIAARYLAAIGSKSLDEYRAQVQAIETRERERAARRPGIEESFGVVFGFLALGILTSVGAPAPTALDEANARMACDALGGRFVPGTGSQLGNCY